MIKSNFRRRSRVGCSRFVRSVGRHLEEGERLGGPFSPHSLSTAVYAVMDDVSSCIVGMNGVERVSGVRRVRMKEAMSEEGH